MNKITSERIHFDKRCFERIGYILSSMKINDIINDIKNKSDNIINYKKDTNRVYVFIYKIDSDYYKIAYDKYRNTLITIYKCKYETSKSNIITEKYEFNNPPLYNINIAKQYSQKHNIDIHTARAILELKCKKKLITKEQIEFAKRLNFNDIINNAKDKFK